MKQDKRRGLTRIALALALAGYCVAPVALAEESAWVDSGETNIFQGTIPWLYSEGGSATTDADHVTLTSDLKGARPTGSETDKRLYSGDKLTVSWEIGDTEGDVDLGGLGDNAKTIDTIRWMSYKDAQGGDPKELATKVTSYTLTDDDRGRYIGIEITPTTQTGTPNVGTALHLYDISTASGGGSDSDNVAPGPVVNQNLKVAIFVDG
ncbi:TPA: SinI family autotransporter-associated protein, partial [Escherichia coli]